MTAFWDTIEQHYQKELPLVIYRKPGAVNLCCILQGNNKVYNLQDFRERGFVFAPFDSRKPAILIRPDEILEMQYTLDAKKTSDLQLFQAFNEEQKDFHINLIKKGVAKINLGSLTKVVLSRKLEVHYEGCPIALFKEILATYFSAFCYMFYHPGVGLWIGATPELLISVKAENFDTMSLAGTQINLTNKPPVWTSKELEEQSLVTNYILEELRDEVQELKISTLESVKAGSLWHLRTTISGLAENAKLEKLVKTLHPTPAVCGIPRLTAKQFILKNENYDREYYTGYLGELNFGPQKENRTELFVNLRCLQLIGNLALLYVGGGITKDSDAKKEWEETISKSSTMLSIILNTIN